MAFEQTANGPTRRGRGWWRILRLASLFLTALLLLFLLPWVLLFTTGWRLDPLIRLTLPRALAKYDWTAEVGEVRLDWMRAHGLVLRATDLRALLADGSEAAGLDYAEIRWPLPTLRARSVLPALLRVQRPRAHLRQNSAGGIEIVPLPPPGHTTPPKKPMHLADLPPWLLPVPGHPMRVEVRQALLHWSLPEMGSIGELPVETVDVELSRDGTELQGEVQWVWPAPTAPVRGAASATLDLGTTVLAVQTDCSEVTVADLLPWIPAHVLPPATVDVGLAGSLALRCRLEPLQPLQAELTFFTSPWMIDAPAFLTGPVNLGELSWSVRADIEQARIEASRLDWELPFCRLVIDPLDLREGDPIALTARIDSDGLHLDQVLALLKPDWREKVGIGEADSRLLGLDGLSLQLAVTTDPLRRASMPAAQHATVEMTAILAIAEDRIPIAMDASWRSAGEPWQGRLTLADLSPRLWQIAWLEPLLPFAISGFGPDLALQVQASGYGAGLPEELVCTLQCSAGDLSGLPLLDKPLPLAGLQVAARLAPAARRLDDLQLEVELLGGRVRVQAAQAALAADHIAAAATLELAGFDAATILPFWPESLLPEWRATVLDLPLAATLERLRLPVAVRLPAPLPVEPAALLTAATVDLDAEWLATLAGARFAGTWSSHLADGAWQGRVEAAVHDWILAEWLTLWPATLLPEQRQQVLDLAPAGTITLATAACTLAGTLALPEDPLTLLQDVRVEVSGLDWAAQPLPALSIAVASWTLAGTMAGVTIETSPIAVAEATIKAARLQLLEPLSDTRNWRLESGLDLDLANLASLLARLPLPPEQPLPAELNNLAGACEVRFTASGPLDSGMRPEQLQATVAGDFTGLQLPPAWLPYQQGPATVFSRLEWAGGRARCELGGSSGQLSVDPWLSGPLRWLLNLEAGLDGAASGTLQLDLTDSELRVDAIEQVKRRGETAGLHVDFGLTGSTGEATPILRADVTYDLWLQDQFSCAAVFAPGWQGDLAGLRQLDISGLNFGSTSLDCAVSLAPEQLTLRLTGAHLDLTEIVAAVSPVVYRFLIEAPPPAEATPAAATQTPVDPAADLPPWLRAVEIDAAITRITFSTGQTLDDWTSHLRLVDLKPYHVRASASERGRTILSLTADSVQPDVLALRLSVPDVAGLANLLVAPLHLLELPDTPMGRNFEVIRRVPDNFAGGRMALDGTLRLDQQEPLLAGSFSFEELFMVKAPCLLRLVAAASGKGFSEQVAFRTFSMEHFSIGRQEVSISKLFFDGPVTMNIFEGRYRFEDQFIQVKGDHYLTNFELEGPILGPPKIYVDNKLTRMLGTDESDWADW